MNKTVFLLLALSSTSLNAALAADADLLRCRGISDATARLACYDNLANVVASAAAASTSAPVAAAGAKAETSPGRGAATSAANTASATPPARTIPEFGFEERNARSTVDRMESRIVGFFAGWGPNSRIRLANGQVWQVSDGSARDIDLDSPKVWIRRGALGAFYLEIDGKNHSPRVKRVE